MTKLLWAVVYIGLIGSLLIGVLKRPDAFKTVFGSVGGFFLNEQQMLSQ